MNRRQRRAQAATDPAIRADRYRIEGREQLKRGTAERAKESLQAALRLRPDDVDAQLALGRAYFELGELDSAEAMLRTALAVQPGNANIHGWMGNVLDARRLTVAAIESYQRALALDPDHWAAQHLAAATAKLGWSVQKWHLPMLADERRNAAFEQAIAAAVGREDVVLDIGTGSGLLAMMAARAGARRVFACEMDPNLAALALRVVRDNGFENRITILPHASHSLRLGVELPEPATVLVTETFDTLLIGEGVLQSVHHAHHNLMAPGARTIPCGAVLMGQLATLPRLKTVHPLRRISGFDLHAFALGLKEERFFPVSLESEHYRALSPPVELARLDFSGPPPLKQIWRSAVPVRQGGPLQVLLLWFELELDKDTVLTSGPGGGLHHWKPVAFVFDEEHRVQRGATVELCCRLGENGWHFELANPATAGAAAASLV